MDHGEKKSLTNVSSKVTVHQHGAKGPEKSEEKGAKGADKKGAEGEAKGSEKKEEKGAKAAEKKGAKAAEKKGAEGGAKGPKKSEKKGAEGERQLPPYHMKESEGLQEQGFEGKDVEHNDMKTSTADWRKEFGPNHPNYKTMAEICKKYPKNFYCLDYLPTEAPIKAPIKSMAEGNAVSLLLFASVLVMHAM